jgi:hypothetical protein
LSTWLSVVTPAFHAARIPYKDASDDDSRYTLEYDSDDEFNPEHPNSTPDD